ncbi:uncharacterized protein LOC128546713 [Mercenaria mercenaria]|uniref:uncharacterized protein LOC128546713 n=1 Tax=Mercenaria mercenaria TaxID=6596 RepID=UPI00234F32A7|nr:uncharacterized protein LOC128546713 [Mercenaria mercenaria]
MMRCTSDMISMYCGKNQKQWDKYLPQVMMAYRASTHSRTGKSPNMLTLGREINLPMTAVIGLPENQDPLTVDNYVQQLQNNLVLAHQVARKTLKKNAIYRKKYYDQRSHKRTFKEKDIVWLYNPTRKVGVCSKLSPKWKGPCLIIQKIDDTTYVIKQSAKSKGKIWLISVGHVATTAAPKRC